MKKIRIGNDFVFNWAIERGGMPEDLSSVLEKHLHLSVFGKRVELVEGVDYDITGNVIRIEVTPAIANITGTYKAEFHYILPDNGLIDEDRKCAVDVDAFQIVAKTAQADDSTEFSMTSDMAIAFKGDKGDSAYEVWLKDNPGKTKEDYFNWLQKPATDIAETVGLQEQARVDAENLRVLAEQDRQTSTATAISNAETATENANTAAQNADDARLAIQSDLGAKAFHGYASVEVAKTLKQVEDDTSVKMTNLVVNGDFRDGLVGWEYTYTQPIVNNKIVTLPTSLGFRYFVKNIIIKEGDKIYVRRSSKRAVEAGVFVAAFDGTPTYNSRIDILTSTGDSNETFTTKSAVYSALTNTDKLGFWTYPTGPTTVGIQSLFAINLTDTFGAGNEPTKEEFELLLATLGIDYFEGEITIPAQKIMQWQLALIRKNKNAIIALGGTII